MERKREKVLRPERLDGDGDGGDPCGEEIDRERRRGCRGERGPAATPPSAQPWDGPIHVPPSHPSPPPPPIQPWAERRNAEQGRMAPPKLRLISANPAEGQVRRIRNSSAHRHRQ